jgi:WD40 repeat protein
MKTAAVEIAPDFYVVGGTMRPDAPSYVERRADGELLAALQRNEFCYVLTARQMGKSSLMIRTAARLRAVGSRIAVLDLTAIGRNLQPEQWYGGLLAQLGQRLELEDELIEFWRTQMLFGPLQRWLKALREIVLPHCPEPLVIFIDEIDAVRSLPFATDEFFAGLRECYNQRGVAPEFQRLTFCLLGVATPADLIRDTRTTPFNIGTRIELHDFTEAEAAPLTKGLGYATAVSAPLLKRILYWTGGHPYLTQRLCLAVAEDTSIRREARVDRLCEALFLSPSAQTRDDNLLFVRERLLRGAAEVSALLELYQRVWLRRAVPVSEADPLTGALQLAGITRVEAGRLRVRNRIYAQVFDRAWIKANLPDAEVRRQRAAYRRGVWRTALISAVLLILIGWLAFTAVRQRNRAEQQAVLNRRLLYFAQMKIVQQEWERANIERVDKLLASLVPQPGEEDLRGFEWYLFRQLAHGESTQMQAGRQLASVAFLPNSQPANQTLVFSQALRAQQDGGHKYLIKRYDIGAQRELAAFRVPAGRNFDLAIFAPDRRRVATDSPQNNLTLWDTLSGQALGVFIGHREAVTAIAFAPAGNRLASGGPDGTVRLWDTVTGQEQHRLPVQPRVPIAVAFSPDGRWLATADETQQVQLWDVVTGRARSTLKAEKGALLRTAFFPSGDKLVATAKDGTLYLWEINSQRRLPALLGHTNEVSVFAFSPDGKLLATGSNDRTVRLWNAATGEAVGLLRGHGSVVSSVAWSDDGKSLATGSIDGVIKLWETSPQSGLVLPSETVTQYFTVTFTPAGELLAVGATHEQKVKVWNLSTGRELSFFAESDNQLHSAAFSPDLKLVATGGMDHSIRLRDTFTGKLLRSLSGHRAPVRSLDFSPDGKYLVSGGEDYALYLHDLMQNQPPISLDGSAANYYRAVFSPDGKWLASSYRNGEIKLWDLRTRTIIKTLLGHADRVRAMTFSPDSLRLATGSADNTIRLWDVWTGQALQTLGPADFIQRAAFSPDGKRLVTGGSDGAIKLWDVSTSEELLSLPGHTDRVSALTFSLDGASLVTSGLDGPVKLWRTVQLSDTRSHNQ